MTFVQKCWRFLSSLLIEKIYSCWYNTIHHFSNFISGLHSFEFAQYQFMKDSKLVLLILALKNLTVIGK